MLWLRITACRIQDFVPNFGIHKWVGLSLFSGYNSCPRLGISYCSSFAPSHLSMKQKGQDSYWCSSSAKSKCKWHGYMVLSSWGAEQKLNWGWVTRRTNLVMHHPARRKQARGVVIQPVSALCQDQTLNVCDQLRSLPASSQCLSQNVK